MFASSLTFLRDMSRELFLGVDVEPDSRKVEDRFMDMSLVRDKTGAVPRMSEYLPYIAYDRKNALFINQHNTLGFCLEANPQTGANEMTVSVLGAIYAKCPKDTGIQFHLLASSNIRGVLSEYGNQRVSDEDSREKAIPYGRQARNDNIYRRFARRRVAHLLRATHTSLTKGFPYILRDFRLVISFSIPGSPDSIIDVQRAIDIRDTAVNACGAAGIHARVLDANQFLNFTTEITQFHQSVGSKSEMPRAVTRYDDMKELRKQVFSPDRLYVEQAFRILNYKPHDIYEERGSAAVHMLSLKEYPDKKGLWEMSEIVGHMLNSAIQYKSPTLITMGVQIQDPEKIRAWVIANQTRATQNAKSEMAQIMPDIPKKKIEWDMAADILDSGGTMVSLYHHIAVFATPDKGLEAEGMASTVWGSQGFTTINSELHQMPAYYACLPMMLSKPFHDDMNRIGLVSTKTNHNAIHLAPLLGDWKGAGSPVMVFGARRGQIVGLDLFANETGNYNANIVGTSGTGKSALLQDIVWSYASIGAKVFIYDLGRSFQRLCHVLGGEYVDIGKDVSHCYNPFTSVTDIMEDSAMIKAIIAVMVSPRGDLDSFQYQAIGVAILLAFGKYGTDTTMTNVRDVFATGRLRDQSAPPDQRIKDLAFMLDPYTKDGEYARFFEGRANIDFQKDFYVFENESLIRKPDLHTVLTLLSLYNVTGSMFLTRNRKKLFAIDEFKQQLTGASANTSFMADAVTAASLRVRKYGGSLITAAQEPGHFFETQAGLAAWNTADWKFMSRLNEENLDALKASGRMMPNEYKRKLMQSLTLVPNAYSEWYVSSPIGEGVVRSMIDPYSLLMFSNKQSDNAPLDALIAQGMSIDMAIETVLSQRGQL
jgi:conjugal transfer ATP-binding protein TraC